MRALRALALTVLTTAIAACATPMPYHYHDVQLGRRTFEVRAEDRPWPGAELDLARFVLYRAAELTRGLGYRYFSVRSYSGAAADYRAFTVEAGRASEPPPAPFPVASDESERDAARERRSCSRRRECTTGPMKSQHITFRLLELDDVGNGSEAVDADAILRELGPFVARRR